MHLSSVEYMIDPSHIRIMVISQVHTSFCSRRPGMHKLVPTSQVTCTILHLGEALCYRFARCVLPHCSPGLSLKLFVQQGYAAETLIAFITCLPRQPPNKEPEPQKERQLT